MKRRLRRIVSLLAPDGACVSGEASPTEAGQAGGTFDVRDAPLHVVAARGERAGRAGRQAWAIGAALAGTGTIVSRWQDHPFAERDRAPVRVPQTEVRVHQWSDGRGVYRTGPLRPSDERQPRRAAERKVRGSAERTCQTRDHAPAPSVQGVRPSVVRFVRGCEDGPHSRTRIADENERPHGSPVGKRRDRVVRGDVECAPARESFGFDGSDDGAEVPRGGCVVASGVLHAAPRQEEGASDASPRTGSACAGHSGSAGVAPASTTAGLRPVAGGTIALPGTPRAVPGSRMMMMAPREFPAVAGAPEGGQPRTARYS